MEFGSIREVQGDTVVSPFLPRLGVRISPGYIYLGDLQYLTRGAYHVEEFIFINPSSIGHVTQMLLVQFEGFMENKAGVFEATPGQPVSIEGDSYLYSMSIIELPAYFDQFPNTNITHAADYVRQRAYTLAGQMVYQQFLRHVSEDGRNKFTLVYIESDDEGKLSEDALRQADSVRAELLQRALASFSIVQ